MTVQVLSSMDNFIASLILNDPMNTPWLLTTIYGPTNLMLKPGF